MIQVNNNPKIHEAKSADCMQKKVYINPFSFCLSLLGESKYASQNSIDREMLKKIAYCESGFNAAAGNGDYGGMYQFATGSWISTRTSMNADTNPALRFNAEEAIRTAAFKIATRGVLSWPNCSK